MDKRLLNREKLLEFIHILLHPRGLPESTMNQILIDFCAGCPDPTQARWLLVENIEPMTEEEIVDRALNMPYIPIENVRKAVVPANHPARMVTVTCVDWTAPRG